MQYKKSVQYIITGGKEFRKFRCSSLKSYIIFMTSFRNGCEYMFFFCFKNKCMHIAYCILNSNTYFFWWRYQQKNKSKTIDCEMCFMGFNFTVPNADRYVSFKNLHDNRSGDSKRWKLLRPYHKISTRCSTLFKTYQNVHWNFFSVFFFACFILFREFRQH